MTSTPLFQTETQTLRVQGFDDFDIDLIHYRVCATPSEADLDKVITVLEMWMGNCTRGVCLHVQHASDGEFDRIDPKVLCHLVGELAQRKEVFSDKLRAACIQVQSIDEWSTLAKNVFLGMYKPAFAFDMVADKDAVNRLFAPFLRRK